MNAAEIAAELCRARGGNFREELEAHLLHGYVWSQPGLFVMARPVPRSADVADLQSSWPIAECDAWFIWLGVGGPAAQLALAPYELPWIGWHRQGRAWTDCHWWGTRRLKERFESALARGRRKC